MQRFHQILFAMSLLGLSWFGMMAVHELGHVFGAALTGGAVERVVLHPLAISRTDVSPNPHPALVVWLGPVLGCALPLCCAGLVPYRHAMVRKVARFFAGFCLIANGAYITFGAYDRVGDCGEMLRSGTPLWGMIFFGAVTICLGLYLWHGLGSVTHFLNNSSLVTPRMAYLVSGLLLAAIVAGAALSPR